MSEVTPDSVSLPPTGGSPAKALTIKKRLLAAGFSAFVPGSGHLLLGRTREGRVLLLVFGLVLSGFWPLRLLRTYCGFVFLVWATLGILAVGAFRAFFAAEAFSQGRPSRFWAVLVIVIVLVGSNIVIPAALLSSGFRAFQFPSSSMKETLDPGDRFMVDRWYYRHTPAGRGNLVVIKTTVLIVKRVIATGGDMIESHDGIVLVNGTRVEEPYVQHTDTPPPEMQTFGPIVIPPGKMFLMGDNRDVSYDSRSFGPLDVNAVVAKPLYIYGFDRSRRGRVLQ